MLLFIVVCSLTPIPFIPHFPPFIHISLLPFQNQNQNRKQRPHKGTNSQTLINIDKQSTHRNKTTKSHTHAHTLEPNNMAVEARHLNLFPSQFIPNREIITNPTDASIISAYNNYANNYSSLLPLSGTTTASENLIPAAPYNPLVADSFHQKTPAMKSDSTLTYNDVNNNVVSVSRKRSRDTINNYYPLPSYKNCGNFSFLGEDISLTIHNQQLDIDNLISQHMEKVRVELEEKRKRQARRLMEAIEVGMMKKLKAKEEEIEKIGRLNMALEERVKSLCIDNQIWRDLAQTNEATANALRTNLEHVLTQLRDGGENATVAPENDAESCCGSNDDNEVWRTVGRGAQDKDVGEGTSTLVMNEYYRSGCCTDKRRLCRNCGKEESCVLILPCRHLCLCTICGSTVHTCPICNCFKNASVHVNMS